jgi:hypothetical protein
MRSMTFVSASRSLAMWHDRRFTLTGALVAVMLGVMSAVTVAPLHAQGTSATTQPPVKQPAPEIYLRAPRDGATVPTTFAVEFGLRHFGVAPAGVNLTGTGHFHVLINVEPPAVGVVIPADSLHRHFGGGQIETTLTLAPGRYTLRAVLADHEHKVISRELISAPVRITVRR